MRWKDLRNITRVIMILRRICNNDFISYSTHYVNILPFSTFYSIKLELLSQNSQDKYANFYGNLRFPGCDMTEDDNFMLSIEAVEQILNYRFSDKSLLAKALTHSSFADSSPSYILTNGQLWLLCASNINTEKLAHVAVRHGLFHFARHNAPSLDAKVKNILADIVEPVAAAVYVDAKFDLKFMWEVFSPLLEPIVALENLQQQPLTMLYELCQK
ncbi:hypothetical protein IFM89_000182 [Coptis chinensis]|uniref:RNase III domain-containing protein n=1 Tax=Coptis chinensis TaxID=261450 RepID=A0A835I8B3_9MAGN|nr:hypothetical protein IFM89_000182 [Coptis chinensis]